MLPDINLDNSGFGEISKKARSQIHEIYPKWNDYNYHDPGITILEMLAFLKEAQQFYLNEDKEEIRKKFLKLLGCPLLKSTPAKTIGKIHEPKTLAQGTKFYMEDICFESEKEETLAGNCIASFIVKEKNGENYTLDVTAIFRQGQMNLYPFGKKVEKGNQFYLCLEQRLEKGKRYSLTFFFDDQHKVKRNPIINNQKFIPLSDVKLSLYTRFGYQETKMKDETMGFLQDGKISFLIGEDMALGEENGCEGYYLKFTLGNSFFDTIPIILDVGFSFLSLVQRDTKAIFIEKEQEKYRDKTNKICNYYRLEGKYYQETEEENGDFVAIYEKEFHDRKELVIGNGFPNQIYQVNGEGLESNQFHILVESIRYQGKFILYEKVEDFDNSKVDSCHYVVEEENATVRFGNGIHGNMPETKIRIVGLAFCKAEQGNITKGKNLFYSHLSYDYMAINYKEAIGGCGGQSIEEGYYHHHLSKNKIHRMVSKEDFETTIKKSAGLRIADCKVLEEADSQECSYDNYDNYHNEIKIVVKPFTEDGKSYLSERYRQNILHSIEDKRLLGSSITLYSPTYIEIEVSIEVCVKPQYLMAKEYIENEVYEYFETLTSFGMVAEYGVLFRMIDSLEAVQEVRTLSMSAKGDHISRNRNGDVLAPPIGVLILEKINCIMIAD